MKKRCSTCSNYNITTEACPLENCPDHIKNQKTGVKSKDLDSFCSAHPDLLPKPDQGEDCIFLDCVHYRHRSMPVKVTVDSATKNIFDRLNTCLDSIDISTSTGLQAKRLLRYCILALVRLYR